MNHERKNSELNLFIILNILSILIIFTTIWGINIHNVNISKSMLINRINQIQRTNLFNSQMNNTRNAVRRKITEQPFFQSKFALHTENSPEGKRILADFRNLKELDFSKLKRNITFRRDSIFLTGFILLDDEKYIFQTSQPVYKVHINPSFIIIQIVFINIFLYLIILFVRKRFISPNIISSDNENLAANIAHELKNPLAGISMFIELLERKISNEPEKDYIDNIKKQVRNLNKIITNFINFAKPFKLNLRPVNLEEIFNQVTKDLKDELKNIIVVKEFRKNHSILADSVLLKQLFINIMINAIDAVNETETKKITISVNEKNSKINIDISNTGIQITEHEKSKLFEPYFTTKIKGSGLGLAICRKIAHAHGGDVVLLKSDYEETVFRIFLKGESNNV